MSNQINISEVFAIMEDPIIDGRQNVFSITFVRDNKNKKHARGSIKHVTRCTKGTRTSKKSSTPKTNKSWQFKRHHAIPLIDLDSNQPLTPKWTHLLKFNGKSVRYYGN